MPYRKKGRKKGQTGCAVCLDRLRYNFRVSVNNASEPKGKAKKKKRTIPSRKGAPEVENIMPDRRHRSLDNDSEGKNSQDFSASAEGNQKGGGKGSSVRKFDNLEAMLRDWRKKNSQPKKK